MTADFSTFEWWWCCAGNKETRPIKASEISSQFGLASEKLQVLSITRWDSVHFCRCKQQEEPQESEGEEAGLQGCLCTAGELTWMLVGKEEGTHQAGSSENWLNISPSPLMTFSFNAFQSV